MKALLCSLLKYPNGDAGAIRQEKLAMMLQNIGLDILVVGLGEHTGTTIKEEKGIAYTSLRHPEQGKFGKAMSHLLYWIKLRTILKFYSPDIVLMDDMKILKTIKLKTYCKRHGIQLIHDSVEWYSAEQFQNGTWNKSYITKNILNRYLIDKNCKVIAISRYLEKHFSGRGLKCINIPIVISEDDLSERKAIKPDVMSFTYAGHPGRKDYLDVILEAFALLKGDELKNVRINIVGCTEQQVLVAGLDSKVIDKIRGHVIFHGSVPHERVLNILEETDFTLLMRDPEKRYAKAGFPTKMVESLSRSTPIICNLTSDMSDCLVDGVNALIVSECSAKSMKLVLSHAIKLSFDERNVLAWNAFSCAKQSFMYSKYLSKMKRFLSD